MWTVSYWQVPNGDVSRAFVVEKDFDHETAARNFAAKLDREQMALIVPKF